MTRNYVVDANILAKLLLNEEDSEIAERFVSQAIGEGIYLYVPSLFSYELVGLFKKYNIPKEVIQDFISSQHNVPYIKIMPFNDELLQTALEMTEQGHPKSGYPHFYDSVYHALAIHKDCDFITADRRHYDKTQKQGHIRLLAQLEF